MSSSASRDCANAHPPARQVRDRRLPDQLGEPGGERRPRHGRDAGEAVDAPLGAGFGVDGLQRPADPLVAEPAQPPRAPVGPRGEPATDRLQHEDVGQARRDGRSPGLRMRQLLGHQSQRVAHRPAGRRRVALHQQDVGEAAHQLAGRRVVEGHHPADEPRRPPGPAVAKQRVLLAEVVLRQEVDARPTSDRRLADQQVATPVRDQGQVAGAQLDRRRARQRDPARPGRHDVEADRVGEGGHLQAPRLTRARRCSRRCCASGGRGARGPAAAPGSASVRCMRPSWQDVRRIRAPLGRSSKNPGLPRMARPRCAF